MTHVSQQIRAQIVRDGPMSLETFITLALAGEPDGYYRRHNPLGAGGDFITAPEISQIFGELIGLWLADLWQQLGCPEPVTVVELGPGRGTLMRDAMRAASVVPGFVSSAKILLVDINAELRHLQRECLRDVRSASIDWAARFEGGAVSGPVLLVANEFLDALPFSQYVYADGGWRERLVGLDVLGNLEFQLSGTEAQLPCEHVNASETIDGVILELSRSRDRAVEMVAQTVRRSSGAALFIDYGIDALTLGDSFQSVRRHTFTDPLMEPGLQDLTSHVDFSAVRRAASQSGARVWPVVEQGVWLERLGGTVRLQRLTRRDQHERSAELSAAYERLISRKGMGTLFKVLSLTYPEHLSPAGFSGS